LFKVLRWRKEKIFAPNGSQKKKSYLCAKHRENIKEIIRLGSKSNKKTKELIEVSHSAAHAASGVQVPLAKSIG